MSIDIHNEKHLSSYNKYNKLDIKLPLNCYTNIISLHVNVILERPYIFTMQILMTTLKLKKGIETELVYPENNQNMEFAAMGRQIE